MLSAGLDIGALWTKAVVVRDGRLAGFGLAPTGDNGAKTAEATLASALSSANGGTAEVKHIVATGVGKDDAGIARQTATEVLCAARGINHLHPDLAGVIDMGGESTRVIKLDARGEVAEFALNDKCAAGTGIFLDEMGSVMGVKVEDMGPLSLNSTRDINITSTCVVFAESEVVSQVARQTPKEDILNGIHRSIATRVHGLVSRAGLSGQSAVVGGLARNVGIVTCLEGMMKTKLVIPKHPQIVNALGAALIAHAKAGG